jgi:hypothetical protein
VAFGDDLGPTIRVCCGPRCGQEPGHRAIYSAVERAAGRTIVRPTLCRGLCGLGVTIVLTTGDEHKARTPQEAKDLLTTN